jgi:hypothetical protein
VSGRVYVSGGRFSPLVSIWSKVVSMDMYFHPLSDGVILGLVILCPRRSFSPFLSLGRLVSSVLCWSQYSSLSVNLVVSLDRYFPPLFIDITPFTVSCTLVLFFSVFLITAFDWSIFVLVVSWS